MLDWVEILKRILHLYKVSTQQELGMALGVPVHIGMDGDQRDPVIPWPILQLVVHDKGVSWDWLLTGTEAKATKSPDTAAPAAGTGDQEGKKDGTAAAIARQPLPGPPRLETRQLERSLLGDESTASRNEPASADDGDLLKELRRLRKAMRRDLEQAERLLDKAGGAESEGDDSEGG